MLLVGKVKIDVPLARDIKGVLVGTVITVCNPRQELLANRTVQDGGHMPFSRGSVNSAVA